MIEEIMQRLDALEKRVKNMETKEHRHPRLNFGAATELTIVADSVTRTKSYHMIDTHAGTAASTDLNTINGGVEGDILILRAAHDDRTVTINDGAGNIELAGSAFALDNTDDTIILIFDGTNWLELSRSDNKA